MRVLAAAYLAFFLTGSEAGAEVPRVAADILPVHGLLSRVMDGLGQPDLVIRADASPHAYAMRPSEASMLENANLVFWIGPELTPWLSGPIETLASDAKVVELLAVETTTLHAFRMGVAFEASDGKTTKDQGGHLHDHGHDGVDPHAWLDPENAKLWLDVMATALADVDPGNAALYRQNAREGTAEIDAAQARLSEALAASAGQGFLVFHDAYQYAEQRFGVFAAGAIALGDATKPGPARIAEVRETVRRDGVTCVVAEPQFNAALVSAVLDGTDAMTVILDPLGAEFPPGPSFYPALIDDVARAFRECGF